MPTLDAAPHVVTTPMRRVLDARTRRTLAAAVARIVHDAPPDLVARIEDRVAGLAPHKQDEVRTGLRLFGGAAAAFASVRRFTPFHALDDAAQDRMLEAWNRSALPQARTLYQLLRRITLLTHYADTRTHADIGYRGALHTRDAAVAWEGPAPHTGDAAHDDDPHALVRRGRTLPPPPEPRPLPDGVITAATYEEHGTITADAVVIGSGAGGAVAAARLAAAGKHVVILEAGEFVPSDEFTEHEGDMTARLYAEGGLRATDDLAFAMLQGATVGGGTTVNWMIMLRTPEHVLHEWSTRAGLEGMDAGAMAPAFDEIEREVNARAVPDDAHSANNRLLLDGAAALGWQVEAGRLNARGCVRSGFCGQGCRYDAKQGTQQVYLPQALRQGATLYANAHAQRIEVRATGAAMPTKRVTAVVRGPRDGARGRSLVIEAPIVVVAAGAVETPLLLQRSGMGGGGVGHFLRLHPTTVVIGTHAHEIQGGAGIPLSATSFQFSRRDPRGYGFWLQCPPFHPAVGAVVVPGFGTAHREMMRQYPHLATMIALVRDGSDQARSSGSVLLDRRGRARIRYALTALDAANVRAAIEAAAHVQLAAGAHTVHTLHQVPLVIRREADLSAIRTAPVDANRLSLFSAHVNGTCRIGTDPATSGIGPDGQRHGVRGVYVLDGAMLPTGVGVNPQETIMALSSVLTRRLLAHWPA